MRQVGRDGVMTVFLPPISSQQRLGEQIKEENVPWKQYAPCWALKVLPIRLLTVHSKASYWLQKPELSVMHTL